MENKFFITAKKTKNSVSNSDSHLDNSSSNLKKKRKTSMKEKEKEKSENTNFFNLKLSSINKSDKKNISEIVSLQEASTKCKTGIFDSMKDNETTLNESKEYTDIFGNKKMLIPLKNYIKNPQTKTIDFTNLALKENHTYEESDNYYFQELNQRLKMYIHPYYFENHKEIRPWMRMLLMEWLMDLSSQFAFKRATFHLAVTLIDIAMSRIENLHASKFQLVGITALVIAAKQEEIRIPSLSMYTFTTENAYDISEIISFEQKMLEIVNWKTNFPTQATWGNLITFKWDLWLRLKMMQDTKFRMFPFFRFIISSDCYMFKKFFYCLDLAILFPDCLQYDGILLCSSLLYVIIGLFSKCLPEDAVIGIYKQDYDISIIGNFFVLNAVIEMFLNEVFGIGIENIRHYIPVASQLVCLTGKEFDASLNHSFDNQKVS